MPTLLVDGVSIEVSREVAVALSDKLWQGLWPGSATSAVKLTDALHGPHAADGRPIVFEAYESREVRTALKSHGILAPSGNALTDEES